MTELENSNQNIEKTYETIYKILAGVEKEVLEKTGRKVLGMGITWDEEDFFMSVNMGVYQDVKLNIEE